MVENAGTTLPLHQRTMQQALGLPPNRSTAMHVNSRQWSAFPRHRLVLATLPTPPHPWQPSHRPSPWDAHFSPHPAGEIG
eukprot:482476-Prorocentrum_lima.AAC.1